MLTDLLQLERPLVLPDVETTGLNPNEARIVEIGFQVYYPDRPMKEWRSLINPGISIPDALTKIHGISDASIASCRECGLMRDACLCPEFKPWPTFAQVAPSLVKGFSNCDFAGKNVRFDLGMFAAEFARAKVEWSCVDARIIDADRLEALGEPRTLSHLYEKHTGKKLEDAHHALADVRGTAELIEAQLRKYSVLPRNLDLLHAAQFPGMIDLAGKFRFVNNVACIMFGKWNGKPMASVDPPYWDWILGTDFSDDVKAIARKAKLKEFPELRDERRPIK